MIVCHCHSVTDREIRRVAAQAGPSCREVGARCRAGTTCKGCLPVIRALLQRSAGERRRKAHPPRR